MSWRDQGKRDETHIHHHIHLTPELATLLRGLGNTPVLAAIKELEKHMALNFDQAKVALDRIDKATTDIAEDVRRLVANPPDPADQAAVDEFAAKGGAIADRLDAINAEGGPNVVLGPTPVP